MSNVGFIRGSVTNDKGERVYRSEEVRSPDPVRLHGRTEVKFRVRSTGTQSYLVDLVEDLTIPCRGNLFIRESKSIQVIESLLFLCIPPEDILRELACQSGHLRESFDYSLCPL